MNKIVSIFDELTEIRSENIVRSIKKMTSSCNEQEHYFFVLKKIRHIRHKKIDVSKQKSSSSSPSS